MLLLNRITSRSSKLGDGFRSLNHRHRLRIILTIFGFALACAAAFLAGPFTRLPSHLLAAASTSTEEMEPNISSSSTSPALAPEDGAAEVVSERTANAKVFVRPDGSHYAKIASTPIHFQDGNGKWQEIDNRFAAAGNRFANRANSIGISVASQAGNQALSTVERDGLSVSFGLPGASGRVRAYGNVAYFENALDGLDLQIDSLSTGLKETVVLHHPISCIFFSLSMTGLTARIDDRGEVIFSDGDGVGRFLIPHAFMQDSATNAAGEGAISEGASYELVGPPAAPTGLRLVLDDDWLHDPARVWPVRVDPSVIWVSTQPDDTYVQSNITVSRQDSVPELKAGYCPATTDCPQGPFTARTLLHYPLPSAVMGNPVTYARLEIFNRHSWSCQARPVDVYDITSGWDGSVVWPNQPSYGGQLATLNQSFSESSNCPGNWLRFADSRLTAKVDAWSRSLSPNYGLAVRAQNEGDQFGWKKFQPYDGWVSTVGTGDPGAVSATGNRTDVFGRANDGTVWHRWWDGTSWSGDNLGGVANTGADAAAWGTNHIDVFVRGSDNALWHKWWDGTSWRAWESLGGTLNSDPAVVAWGANRFDVFVKGTDNALHHKWWDGASWSGWEHLGGELTSAPDVSSWGPGRLDVFVKGTDNAIWHKWYAAGSWSPTWEGLGGAFSSDPAAVSWGANRIDVFVRGTDNSLQHKWFDGSWQGWESLGGTLNSGPDVSSWGAPRLDVFARGTDNTAWHRYYNGSSWSAWESLEGSIGATPGSPLLYIEYLTPPNVPDNLSPASGGSYTSAPALSARYSDPDGTSGNLLFRIKNSSGATLSETSTGPFCSGCSGSFTPGGLGEGLYYWDVRGSDGQYSAYSAQRSFILDSTAPPAPSISSSTHPNQSSWYSSNSPAFSWIASDTSPIIGYSYLLDQAATTTPDTTSEGSGTSTSYSGKADGAWYFHVRAQNASGLWGAASHYKVQIDATAPTPPTAVASTSHVARVASSNRTASMTWLGGSDSGSGVAGYSWTFNTSPTTPANTTVDGGPSVLSASSASLSDGLYYFHVRTVDVAGGGSTDQVFGPIVIDANGVPGLSSTLTTDAVAQSDDLGLEQFFPVSRQDLGTAEGFVHLRGGNLVVRQTQASVPRQGLNVAVRLSYNSQSPLQDSGMGPGWLLSSGDLDAGFENAEDQATGIDLSRDLKVATLKDLVNNVATVVGNLVEFTDGDGTTHRFVRNSATAGTRYDSPPGVSLRLRDVKDQNGIVIAYELVRPDGVVYRAEDLKGPLGLPTGAWRIISVTDRRGNQITYEYSRIDVSGVPKVRLARIKHNRSGSQVLAQFDYNTSATLISIRALPGYSALDPATGTSRSWERRNDFTYSAGKLASVVQNAHASVANGQRTTSFGYDSSSGLLNRVTDGRANPTTFSYTSDSGVQRMTGMVDRRGKTWAYSYGPPDPNTGEKVTTLTSPVGAAVAYKTSQRAAVGGGDNRIAGGNILEIADAGNNAGVVRSTYQWVQNRLTSKKDGLNNQTLYEYNDLGLVTKVTRPAPNSRADITDPAYPKTAVASALSYSFPSGFSYASCTEPSSSPPVSKVGYCQQAADNTSLAAADNISAQRRVTSFGYDSSGNLTSMIQRADPSGSPSSGDRTTALTYYSRGGLKTVNGPRTDVTDVTTYGDTTDATYGAYDPTGMPARITDALGKVATFGYTPYGMGAKTTDRDGRIDLSRYDERDNLIESTDPAERKIAYAYDADDNRTKQTSPRGTETPAADDFTTNYTFDNNGWLTKVSAPGETETSPRAEAIFSYNNDGTKATETSPAAATTSFSYYPNRQLSQMAVPAMTSGPAAITNYEYDLAGRLSRTVLPATNTSGSQRPEARITYTPQSKVSERQETSAAGGLATTDFAYSAHGEQAQVLGPRTVGGERQQTLSIFDPFGEVTKTSRRLPGRWLDSVIGYDPAGNRIRTTQPDGSGATLESLFSYDALNRLITQTKDPFNPDHKVTYTYSDEGLQLTRADQRISDGVTQRSTTNAYNPDRLPSSTISTDSSGQALSTCNYAAGSGPASGYDSDGNLLVSRTLSGTGGCSATTTLKTLTMTYDHRGYMASQTQALRSAETGSTYSRTQTFSYRNDGARTGVTHDGLATNYAFSPAGLMESMTDWRGRVSGFSYTPSGSPTSQNLGGVATSAIGYHPDGMPNTLAWTNPASVAVRSHTNIAYDLGGLRTAESVSVLAPAGAPPSDTSGTATWGYDLADRLVSYASPFKMDIADSVDPSTTYTLNDGGNVTDEATMVGTDTRFSSHSTFSSGRLTAKTTTIPGLLGPITENQTFGYSVLGEETSRVGTDPATGATTENNSTSYDPAGHTGVVVDNLPGGGQVTYLYDASDHLISRTETTGGVSKTTLYFYLGAGSALAEETDGAGATKLRYLVDADEDPIAQQSFRLTPDGHRDPTDLLGTWSWLLDDPSGNLGTRLDDQGTVIEQSAYDPYGKPEKGASTKRPGSDSSSLGYRKALTDAKTGYLLLGPRQYDPTTARFTSPDYFVASALDLETGTDELTGNRYLFAAANPISYFDDGHKPKKNKNCKDKKDGGWLERYNKCMSTYKAQNDFYKSLSFDVAGVMEDLLSFKIPVGRGRGLGSFLTRQGAIRLLKNVAVRSAQRPASWAFRGIALNLAVTAFGFGAQGGQAMYCEARAFQGRTS